MSNLPYKAFTIDTNAIPDKIQDNRYCMIAIVLLLKYLQTEHEQDAQQYIDTQMYADMHTYKDSYNKDGYMTTESITEITGREIIKTQGVRNDDENGFEYYHSTGTMSTFCLVYEGVRYGFEPHFTFEEYFKIKGYF